MSRPVRLRCSLSCLGLPEHTYRPLVRALGYGAEQTVTVSDVLKLARREQLGEIRGIGRGRVAEIENTLRAAGFKIHHDHRQPDHGPPSTP